VSAAPVPTSFVWYPIIKSASDCFLAAVVRGRGLSRDMIGEVMDWLLALLLGYALGSIPFGLLLAKAAGKGDIRSIGSGNIGATNVLRTGSKGLAAAVLLLDLVKGYLPAFLAWRSWPETAGFVALVALIGQCGRKSTRLKSSHV